MRRDILYFWVKVLIFLFRYFYILVWLILGLNILLKIKSLWFCGDLIDRFVGECIWIMDC